MNGRDFTERDMHLALDGELSADDRAAFELWLDASPERKALSARYAADHDRLRAAVSGVGDEPVPERLRAIVMKEEPGPVRSVLRRWQFAAAAVLLLALTGSAGYALGLSGWRPVDLGDAMVADRAIEAHVIYSAEKLHVVEVGADQKDHLVGWLSKRVGTTLVAPDFSAEGYELVGGRLLPADSKPAAQFMYQDQTGARVSLYVAREADRAETGFRRKDEQGACAFYWLDAGYGYAVTGTQSSDATLKTLANSAYMQMLKGQGS